MTEDEHGAIDPAAEQVAIRKRAMDMLARREHAPAELAAKLQRRGHAHDDAMPVIDALIDDGLLSATRYADALVASHARRGVGPVRIRADLTGVDIAEAEIDRALSDADIDWPALAASVRVKRFGPETPVDFPTKAKQMRFLQRRGFDGEAIAAAVDDADA